MFKSMFLKTKLNLSFGVVLVFLLLVGAIGSYGLFYTMEEFDLVAKNRMPSIQALQIIQEGQTSMKSFERTFINPLVVDQEFRNGQYKRIKHVLGVIDSAWKVYEALPHSLEEKAKWDTAVEAWKKWMEVDTKIFEFAKSKDALIASGKANTDPEVIQIDQDAFNLAMSSRKLFFASEKSLKDIIELNLKITKERGEVSDKKADFLTYFIILLSILAFIISNAAVLLLRRSIFKQLGGDPLDCMKIANEVEAGNFTDDIKLKSGDDTSLLASMKKMSTIIKQVIEDTEALAKNAIAGKLDNRADSTKFSGQYKSLVEEINNTLDAVIFPLNLMGEYVDRISKGDMPPEITQEYKGDFNEIKTNLNALIKSTVNASHIALNISKGNLDNKITLRSGNDELMKAFQIMTLAIHTLVEDAMNLADSAKRGELSVRAQTDTHGGDFKAIIEGFNATLDNVIGPLNVAAEYVDRISKGDLPNKITEEYNGDFNELKNNLNTCIDSIAALVSDADTLAQAAINGELNVRADVNKHKGDFRKIISGVNATLDSVITPLKFAAHYVEDISKGDIPAKITDDFQGDFNAIKENLNTCIDSINDLIDDANMLAKAALQGELQTRANAEKHHGDFRKIIEGVNHTLDSILEPINEAVVILKSIAAGDLSVIMEGDYKGDHAILKDSINTTLQALNEVLSQVSITTEEVNRGSLQVADASTALSQGATEQAASLEEITSSMSEVGSQTKENAHNASVASTLTFDAREAAEKGNREMAQLNKAMNEISDSSKNIEKIIRVIDEIAFQTNLLALNAAVEAARAGRHGKGFAVVAEEVRNLAARSATAARETSTMIEDSIKSVESGSLLALRTSEALEEIKNGSVKAADLVGEIATLSNEQAQSIAQINEGLVQIDKVTQTNTATSEESASAAEELSSQANQLKLMLSRFRLRENTENVIEHHSFPEDEYAKSLRAQKRHKKVLPQSIKHETSPEDYIKLDEDDFDRY